MKHVNIKKVLMCQPLHFSSLNYSINPWMTPGTIDNKKALKQWQNLVATYKSLNINVATIDQHEDHPDMVFATDQAVIHDNKAIMSRFKHHERRGETKHYERWFEKQGYNIHMLPDDVYFEGNGNAFFLHDKLFVGVGYRTDKTTCRDLEKFFDREVIPLKIVDPHFYHLDIGLLPINDNTAFYYPPAFSPKSRKQLQKLIPHLIELTREEAMGFAGNSVVHNKHVVHQKNNPTFTKKLNDLGYTSVEVDLSEFKKSGGGVHCLTNILETN